MKKTFLTVAIVVASMLGFQGQANALGPAANVTTGHVCTNSGGNLTMRSGPGQNFAKLTSLAYGTNVVILDTVTGRDGMMWYKVRAGKRIGWVRYDYVCGV